MKKILLALPFTFFAASAHAAIAQVPEIDALSGLAAIAVVGGAVTLLWERRRRK